MSPRPPCCRLAKSRANQGDAEEARTLLQEALACHQSSPSEQGSDEEGGKAAARVLGELAALAHDRDERARLLEEARVALVAAVGARHRDVAVLMGEQARGLGEEGRWEEAEVMLARAAEMMAAVGGAAHPDALTLSKRRAQARWARGDPGAEAEGMLSEVLLAERKALGACDPRVRPGVDVMGERGGWLGRLVILTM
jgi:hypothetical protein